MSRFKGALFNCILILVAICCENKYIRFDKTQYLESCCLSIEQMLLSDSQEDSLARLVFDMDHSPNLHFRDELINDANILSCKALLSEYGSRIKHGYNDSLLFAHYYALGISATDSPRSVIDLTLSYAKGQSGIVKERIGQTSFYYAKDINDTLALQSIALTISGIDGSNYKNKTYLGYDGNALSDEKAKKSLYWNNLGLEYAGRINNDTITSSLISFLEHATYAAWKLDDSRFSSYADSLIGYYIQKGNSPKQIGSITVTLDVHKHFYGAIYSRYIQLIKAKEYKRAETVLNYYCSAIKDTTALYLPLRDLIPVRQRQDYHEPVLPDSSNLFSSKLDRNILWYLYDYDKENRGGIDAEMLCLFEKARLLFLKGDRDYSQWLNRAFYNGVYCTFPATARVYISNYLRPSFQYNQGLINYLTFQYNNSDPKSVYDALLFIKSASESIPIEIYNYAKKHSPVSIQSYIDSLRFYDIKSRESVGGGFEQDFLENEIGPHVNDVLYKNITSYSEIQEKLSNDALCIEFYAAPSFDFSDEYSYRAAILTTEYKEPRIVDICSSKDMRDLIRKKDLYKTSEAYNILWKPLENYLSGKKTVFFSTDRLLNICNIQAILTPDNGRLGQVYELVQLSSTKEILNRTHTHKYQSIALFGGIEYESNGESSTNSHSPLLSANSPKTGLLRSFQRSDFSPLPFSKVEIDDISTFAKKNGIAVQYFCAEDGTEDAFKQLSGQHISILHIATHGFYYSEGQSKGIDYFSFMNNKDRPLDRCGLLFAGSLNTWRNPQQVLDREDGILLGEEIARLDFTNVDLVVISACKSALGDINSEGISGLRQAFKRAGVKSILITLTDVDDKATSFFMRSFYEKLFESGNRYKSYNYAVDKMKSSKDYSDPSYWANYVLLD